MAIMRPGKKNEETGEDEAPIIDLTAIASLQDWTVAAANFIENGSVKQLAALSRERITPILKETKGKDEESMRIKGYINGLNEVVDEIKFCRGMALYNAESIKSFKQRSELLNDTFIKPLNPLLERVNASLAGFSAEPSAENCLFAAKWCFEKGDYQAAVTELKEGVTTFFCLRHNLNIRNKDERLIVEKAFKKKTKNENDYIPGGNEDFEKRVDEVAGDDYLTPDLLKLYDKLEEVRNDFNHSGMNKRPLPVKTLKAQINKAIDGIGALLAMKEKEPVLINLSNHPYDKWPEEQKEAAKAYGACRDMPFPAVDPDADEEEIQKMADDIVRELLKLEADCKLTVHVAGEMSLTFALVSKLKSHGIKCIVATSCRNTTDLPDGRKLIEFRFKKFREYAVC